MNTQVKKVLVTGGNGYVGNYIMKAFAMQHPDIQIVGMSRRGAARQGEAVTPTLKNVSYIKGNCLKPDTYQDSLEDVDAIIHTVGVLVNSTRNPDLSFKAMNKDAAVNMARDLNLWAEKQNRVKNFVMMGSEKAPPFMSEYLTRKIEAENFIINECKNIKPCLLRPGFIVDGDHRSWSPALGMVVDLAFMINEKAVKPLPGVGPAIDFLFPAKSVRLS